MLRRRRTAAAVLLLGHVVLSSLASHVATRLTARCTSVRMATLLAFLQYWKFAILEILDICNIGNIEKLQYWKFAILEMQVSAVLSSSEGSSGATG